MIRLPPTNGLETTTKTASLQHAFSRTGTPGRVHLRVLETTDLHMHVLPYDYYADRPEDDIGLARTAILIRLARQEAQNSLLIDNGDFLQGNPMGDYVVNEGGLRDGDLHPIIAAMNALDFDAITLGNHEFNYGLDFLMTSLARTAFPVICSNVVLDRGRTALQDRTLLAPYVVLDRLVMDGTGTHHPIKVGLIGFVPPQIMKWDQRHLEGKITARDIMETAHAYLPEMKEAGADIIIALAHSGIGSIESREGMENAAGPLAALNDIDAVLAGHSHLVFPSPRHPRAPGVDPVAGTLAGKPAVQAGSCGSHLGVIDLLLERDGGQWQVISQQSEARPIAQAPGQTDKTVSDCVADAHQHTLSYIRRPVGKTTAPLHSYFALVSPAAAIQLVADAQQEYVAEQLKGTEHASLPLLSAVAPFKAGGRGGPGNFTTIPAGDLAIRHIADLYHYPNSVRAVRVTGHVLLDWLERSVAIFHQIMPGTPDQVLLQPDFPSYNFDMIHGLDYQIDLSQPAKFALDGSLQDPLSRRVVDLNYRGQPVDLNTEFIVATNNYRTGGGEMFPMITPDIVVLEAPDAHREVLVRHIASHGTLAPKAQINWRFAPMPGTSVLFDSAIEAENCLDDIDLDIVPVARTPDGFMRYRLHL